MKPVILSSKGLANLVNSALSGNDFTFSFGSKCVQINNNYAEFISPKVSKLHRDDNTANSISFDFNLNEYPDIFSDDVLLLLKNLSSGNSIEIDENQSFKFQIISLILGNDELHDIIIEKFPNFVNEANFDERLKYLELYHHFLSKGNEHHEFIDYISSHFYSIEKNKLLKFSRSILYTIISNDHLKLESEDSLVDFINQIFESRSENDNDIGINKFISCVDFSELSEEKLKTVLNRIDHKQMITELWVKICGCYGSNIQIKKQSTPNRYTFLRKNIDYNGDATKSFEGIIDYLTKLSNGNVHDNGTIVATSSSVYSNDYHPKFATDYNNHAKFFCTQNQPNSWICYDLKNRKIHPTFYTVRTRIDGDATHHHPMFWVIEGSNDNNDWKNLDTRNDIAILKLKNTVQTFKIQAQLSLNESFRYIRFRQTGLSSASYNYLNFSALEYFGFLYES